MHEYTLTHLSDAVLLRDLAVLLRNERLTAATLLAHLAEVDARRLYAPAGHPSMFAYCIEVLHFSEDVAYKRIRAARAARQFPALFMAIAEGKLHLAAVSLLAPHLTVENVQELIEAGTHRSKAAIEELIAIRFTAPEAVRDCTSTIRPLPRLAPGRVESGSKGPDAALSMFTAAQAVEQDTPNDPQLAPGRVQAAPASSETGGPERYRVQLTIPNAMHDKLRRAQALLGHAVPSGDIVRVLDRALDALIKQLETRKAGSPSVRKGASRAREQKSLAGESSKSPSTGAGAGRSRYIPAHVRRAVWERDHGQCTFVTRAGHRCSARRFLEFDHVDPVARGGRATVGGLRLRCRTHNQLEAEKAFGVAFMKWKREQARLAATNARAEVVREPACFWVINSPRGELAGVSG